MSEPTVAVVDAENRFVRWADRAEVHGNALPHRSVHVLVFDSTGRLLLQQRRADKLTYPSHWDVSVAGHVERDDYPAGPDDQLEEVYTSVAARELMEELSIDAPLRPLWNSAPIAGVHYEHLRLFEATWDGPVTLQPSELAAVRWMSPSEWDAEHTGLQTTRALDYWIAWLRGRDRFTAR